MSCPRESVATQGYHTRGAMKVKGATYSGRCVWHGSDYATAFRDHSAELGNGVAGQDAHDQFIVESPGHTGFAQDGTCHLRFAATMRIIS